MVTFVEQATLKVVDQSSNPIRQIGRATSDLLRASKGLNGTTLNINGLDRAKRQADDLRDSVNRVPTRRNIAASATGACAVIVHHIFTDLRRLRAIYAFEYTTSRITT
ncbi:MAG: hypothetical protein COA37_04835 [Hoeflea sp.]|uniref:hypothetical protein n=1 Tax=Hoeflea sp. TaxID=1940281 RepID=UPI000C0CDE24|nr:hypothetical protein [Hoeflea sp.]PHR25056.1 MAG: hypothetical protein COA37_04835 [Hoeflea sp.]